METTAEVSDKLLLENITERVETTHQSYQSTSIDGRIMDESRTVVFQSTQEIVTTIAQPLGNNSFYPSVNENASILEHNKYDVNVGNTFSNDKSEDVLVGNVIENDPELILTTESESDMNLVINEKANEDAGVNVISNIALGGGQKREANEYMLEQQSENVYMPDQKQDRVSLVSEQVYATEMISDDSQDNIFPNEAEQNATEESNILSTEGDIDKKDENIDFDTGEQNQAELEQNPLKCETPNVEFVEVEEGIQIENVEENAIVGDVMEVQENEEGVDLKEETAALNVEPTENDKELGTDDVEEMDTTTEQTTEIVDTSGTSNEAELTDVPATSSDNVSLENYTLPEGLEVTEIQEGEYQTEQGNSDGTLVLMQNYEQSETFEQISEEENASQMSDDQHDVYMKELRSEAESRQSTSSTSSAVKQPSRQAKRGRKPTYDIPMHVLGHDISKPVETVPNGRAPPKPRLGVKVPYRNLTSQIVSKAEIEKEVMQRARLKQEQAMAKGDVLFARKLTQRLARKIAPSPNHPKKVVSSPYKAKAREQPLQEENVTELTDPLALEPHEVSESQEEPQKINNDSDLLAILEGEGDDMPVLPKEVPQPIQEDADVKMMEREIALQQLQELPHQEPTQRVFRGRQAKLDARAPVLTVETTSLSKAKLAEKAGSAAKQSSPSSTHVTSDKENTSRHARETPAMSPRKDQVRIDLPASPKKGTGELEPQVKVNMVLKTYSRKRKTVELSEPFPESPSPKKPMLSEMDVKIERSEPPSDVYVTKSSRVIKKKVIWDPDEITVRSPRSVRADSPSKTPKHSERIVEKRTPTEKVHKEKSPEKKQYERPVAKRMPNEKTASPAEKKPPKTDSPKNSKTPLKNKKSLSEVDRLLMDEGAVKMLYDLKNTDDAVAKKKKDVYSVERAQKEIMKKANEIKNDLQQTTSSESPKSLRKKAEGFPAALLKPALIAGTGERKMSKDSTRSSLHTPPGSPAYSQGSMLVRRRSSSSISSSDDVNVEDNAKVRRKSAPDAPKSKKVKRSEEPHEDDTSVKETPQPKAIPTETKPNQFKSFVVKKSNKHAIIDLHYDNDKCYCTAEVLEELTVVLKKFAKDKDCNVVSITSSSKAFCSGLDYASLFSNKEDIRRKHAVELSGKVKDFLLCLLNFPKVLVAGIKGECVGLGVTMLPLFDMVIASDTATFSTPYASLGCVAEAGFLLSSPHLTNHGLAAELLFTTQKFTADDVFRRGLISRLCWPEKYNETLKTILTSISQGSKQSLETTKKQLRRHLVQSTEAAINAESKLLVEHWTSPECQKNFARLAEPEGN